jgi:hypothetical protein
MTTQSGASEGASQCSGCDPFGAAQPVEWYRRSELCFVGLTKAWPEIERPAESLLNGESPIDLSDAQRLVRDEDRDYWSNRWNRLTTGSVTACWKHCRYFGAARRRPRSLEHCTASNFPGPVTAPRVGPVRAAHHARHGVRTRVRRVTPRNADGQAAAAENRVNRRVIAVLRSET